MTFVELFLAALAGWTVVSCGFGWLVGRVFRGVEQRYVPPRRSPR